MLANLFSSIRQYIFPPNQGPSPVPDFPVLDDSRPDDKSLPAFMVSRTRGFLPRADPIIQLPSEFAVLQSLLDRMPIVRADGSPGLLATGDFGAAVEAELPDLRPEIEKYKHDLPLINALYREYSFLISAYLLEPCHQRYLKGESYGLARNKIPKEIALPMAMVADISGFKPWLEYAGSYALYNYRLLDPLKGLTYDNLALIRAFEKGLDRTSSEAGFVLVHISMACNSSDLVSAALDAIDGCEAQDRDKFTEGLLRGAETVATINTVMSEMWTKSKPRDYATFRTFIFGILNQDMFPDGVIYEGVSDEPRFFRGGSGANDSMIPLCDNLLEVEMPESPLTDILKDFRNYRPGNHREFLEWVQLKAPAIGIKKYALEAQDSALAYLKMLDQIRNFRWRHWQLTREYVMKQTKHKVATGGSPVMSWLPNQLAAVLKQVIEVSKHCDPANRSTIEIVDRAEQQLVSLQAEMAAMAEEKS